MKLLLLAMILVLLLTLPEALAAVTVSVPQQLNVVLGQSYVYPISINNSNPYSIFNAEFMPASGFTFPTVVEIPAGQVYQTTANFTPQTVGDYTVSTTFKQYNKTITTTTPQTFTVTLGALSISPNNLTLHSFDTIQWVNNASGVLTVRGQNSEYEFILNPGQSASRVFTTNGQQQYMIAQNGFVGLLNVLVNTQETLIHDASTDLPVSFNVKSINQPAGTSVSPLLNNFVLDYNEEVTGVLQLLSNGTAVNVNLKADKWVTFAESSITFTSQKLVLYTLKPVINRTEDTGFTHNISITLTSSNTPVATTSISVLIKAFNFTAALEQNRTKVVLATREQLVAFCSEFPDACPKINVTQYVYINQTKTKMEDDIQSIKDNMERLTNKDRLKDERMQQIEGTQIAIKDDIAVVKAFTAEVTAEKQKEEKQNVFNSVLKFILLVIGGGAVGVTLGILYLKKKKTIAEAIA